MDVQLEPGAYIVAVSGGVDSVALLDMLHRNYADNPAYAFVVAHFDHGIREDSSLDRQLVQSMARSYGFAFESKKGRLPADASEDTARQARYEFLQDMRWRHNAKAIITAHHQDDVLETAVLNLLRGTKRKGVVSLRSKAQLTRPLLHVPKADLIAYATRHNLKWREDSTNKELRYLRNYIRHKLLNSLQEADRKKLLQLIRNLQKASEPLEAELAAYLNSQPAADQLDRQQFIMLPHDVAREVMASWLRTHKVQDISSDMIERLVRAAKIFVPGRRADVDKNYVIKVTKSRLALIKRER